jgi:hypothetical protein
MASSLPTAQRTGHAGLKTGAYKGDIKRNGANKDKVKRTGLKTRRYKVNVKRTV